MTAPIRLSIVLPAHNEEENIAAAITHAQVVAERLCDDHEASWSTTGL